MHNSTNHSKRWVPPLPIMTSERKRLTSNGLNFVVTDYGKKGATPVVLLHGFPNSANVWEKQASFHHPRTGA